MLLLIQAQFVLVLMLVGRVVFVFVIVLVAFLFVVRRILVGSEGIAVGREEVAQSQTVAVRVFGFAFVDNFVGRVGQVLPTQPTFEFVMAVVLVMKLVVVFETFALMFQSTVAVVESECDFAILVLASLVVVARVVGVVLVVVVIVGFRRTYGVAVERSVAENKVGRRQSLRRAQPWRLWGM